jgi:mRNA interferase MazF
MVSNKLYVPEAGHVIKIDFDPSDGHEQRGWRPGIVLSPSSYNAKTRLAVVVPITSQVKGYPFEVQLPPNMKTTGVVLADAIRNLDWHARNAKFVEVAPREVIEAVNRRLVALLQIDKL